MYGNYGIYKLKIATIGGRFSLRPLWHLLEPLCRLGISQPAVAPVLYVQVAFGKCVVAEHWASSGIIPCTSNPCPLWRGGGVCLKHTLSSINVFMWSLAASIAFWFFPFGNIKPFVQESYPGEISNGRHDPVGVRVECRRHGKPSILALWRSSVRKTTVTIVACW